MCSLALVPALKKRLEEKPKHFNRHFSLRLSGMAHTNPPIFFICPLRVFLVQDLKPEGQN